MALDGFTPLPQLPAIPRERILALIVTRSLANDWADWRVHGLCVNLARLVIKAADEYEFARSHMKSGLADPQQLMPAVLMTANSLEASIIALVRAQNAAVALARISQYEPPPLSLRDNFWQRLTDLRHAVEHLDERLAGDKLRSDRQPIKEKELPVICSKDRKIVLGSDAVDPVRLTAVIHDLAVYTAHAVEKAGPRP